MTDEGGPVGLDQGPMEGTMDAHEVKGTVREAAGKAERAYGEAKERVGQAAQNFIERENLETYGEGAWENLMGFVQDNPGSAIGISLLVGAGIGALISYLASD